MDNVGVKAEVNNGNEKFKCVDCDEIKDKDDDTSVDYPEHWLEPLMMGKCLVCAKQFACAECCAGWSYKERHYCKDHEDKYDDKDSRWKGLDTINCEKCNKVLGTDGDFKGEICDDCGSHFCTSCVIFTEEKSDTADRNAIKCEVCLSS
jgi:hypothetical protein